MLSRETGHSRVPAPPHISTGIMGESIAAAIWRNYLAEGGIVALSYSIFHNRPHGKILFLVTDDWLFASHFLPWRRPRGGGLRGAVPQMDIPIQPLLNAAKENLRSLVQDQRL